MFAKVFTQIFDSSLAEDWQVRHVFEDMLKLCDADGVIDITPQSIARRANMPLEIVQRGIAALEQPDPASRSPEHEGRRIVRLDEHREWGWIIVNYSRYRMIASDEQRRENTAERVSRHREKTRGNAPVTQCNAPVTQCNAPVTQCNAPVTLNNALKRTVTLSSACNAKHKEKQKQKEKEKKTTRTADLLFEPIAAMEFPESLNTPEFQAAWAAWQQCRKESRRPLTPISVKQQLEMLGTWGVTRACAALKHSTMNGYQGIFEPKTPPGQPDMAFDEQMDLAFKKQFGLKAQHAP